MNHPHQLNRVALNVKSPLRHVGFKSGCGQPAQPAKGDLRVVAETLIDELDDAMDDVGVPRRFAMVGSV